MTNTSTAVPELARADWTTHPHYPSQVLLLGSHESFRRVADFLQREVRREGALLSAQDLFERWMGALSGHEGYEERKLYPYLERRWGVDLDDLRQGHETLHACRDAIREAFVACRSSGRLRSEALASLATAMDAYGHELTAHLELEENRVIPLLLELTPDEFAAYYALPIRILIDMLNGDESAIAT